MRETGFLKRIIRSITGSYKDESDEGLIELFVTGKDEGAFEEIVNRYGCRIYGLALRITSDHHRAEEVLQEVFLTLIQKSDTFRGEARFSSWLYRVTVNSSYMHLRSERKHEADVSLDGYVPYDENGTLMGRIKSKDWSDRPDSVLFSKEAMEIIDRAVSELPEPYRVVFHLRDVEGLSNEEISEVLGISVSAVKSRLHRARLFLRDRLSDYFYEWRR
ncbi:MAG TPA: sigma-70 family RNA polymerase sigma factor [Thermodesulfobacteriota bacterium]|nr:sigma-70 family RNA polymerase sigma factor [Thermodesulfobacteriota bacterium]